jgi:hypothetical protein
MFLGARCFAAIPEIVIGDDYLRQGGDLLNTKSTLPAYGTIKPSSKPEVVSKLLTLLAKANTTDLM